MKTDDEGFWYPSIDRTLCIDCGLCDKVCPIFNKKEIRNTPHAYACINKNENIRLESSSGGLFSLIAEYIIKNDGIIFGVGFNENFEVVHSYIRKRKDLNKFRGSKYVQSKIGDTYKQAKEFINLNKLVLFTGTPCQISGLYSYLGSHPDNLITIDLICHGVPSPDVWKKYIKYREFIAKSKVKEISFRNKTQGWKRFSEYFLFENNQEYIEELGNDLYLKAFLKNTCLRPSCYECNFKNLHRESDITLADFWGIDKILPEMDDDKGTSLLFINSEQGRAIFNAIQPELFCTIVNINEAVKFNSAAIESVKYNSKRKQFMKQKDIMDFDKVVKKYCTTSLPTKMISLLKSSIKRILFY
jgi:coenzyme F420-reducing hydrogenase beta subunit